MDHFALEEKDAYECTRNIVSTLNFQLPEEEEPGRRRAEEEPLYSPEELLGLAPRSYSYSLDVRMVQNERNNINTLGSTPSDKCVILEIVCLMGFFFRNGYIFPC